MAKSHAVVSTALAGLLSLSALAGGDPPATRPATPTFQQQIEDDWIAQSRLRHGPQQTSGPAGAKTTRDDAIGAVDGVKNGKWGFHTELTGKAPQWWQVDLGRAQSLDRAVLYNRCDIPTTMAKFALLLSEDAKEWREVYRHNGQPFFGATDKKPLIVSLKGHTARFVRVQNPPGRYVYLDELELYAAENPTRNIALGKSADQSSLSQWSVKHTGKVVETTPQPPLPVLEVIERGRALAAHLQKSGVNVDVAVRDLAQVAGEHARVAEASPAQRNLYLRARGIIRQLALANPLLDFDRILFVKRAPGSFSHMSDQFYSWWSRPGGGVYILENIKSDAPTLRHLTGSFPEGSFLSPDLSYNGGKVLFAWCRHYPGRSNLPNKVDKLAQAEDAFYHIFEMNIDGTGLRQITRGRYDDMFPRYLPSGEIVFLSTRRGTHFQCSKAAAQSSLAGAQPDSYVRCGGDPGRPVALYTMHVMDADGGNLRPNSAFESFEWDPNVAHDGRILYARWDYVDRFNGPYMKLWSTGPDGTNPVILFGPYARNPQCIFEARSIPGSRKILATASAHHSITGGSLILFDPTLGVRDDEAPLTRLTPEVCFPETEGWPATYYQNPYPLSEDYYLTGWSNKPLRSQGNTIAADAVGLYLYDRFGNRELLHRDPAISSMYPLPVRPRPRPPVVYSGIAWDGPQEGRFLIQNIYEGLSGVAPGSIKRLRIVGMPAKTQPNINTPVIGVTVEDPGKCVLGSVPVEADGSAYFRVPSGVSVFFQALDEQNRAVQTMRSLTYVQPGQTLACIGCHEKREKTPLARSQPLAALREPSRITPGPAGSWPLRFDELVQPVLDKSCVSCHRPDAPDIAGRKFDLTPDKAYASLVGFGKPSLINTVKRFHGEGLSVPNAGPSHTSAILALLRKGHHDVRLDSDALERLVVWMDTYAQRQGSFSAEQEEELRQFRIKAADLLATH